MINRPHIDRLVWDDWNMDHIAKHAVTTAEAEDVTIGEAMYRASYKDRLMAIGPTVAGRMITIVLGQVPNETGVFYVFSARPSSRDERRDYMEAKGGETL